MINELICGTNILHMCECKEKKKRKKGGKFLWKQDSWSFPGLCLHSSQRTNEMRDCKGSHTNVCRKRRKKRSLASCRGSGRVIEQPYTGMVPVFTRQDIKSSGLSCCLSERMQLLYTVSDEHHLMEMLAMCLVKVLSSTSDLLLIALSPVITQRWRAGGAWNVRRGCI